MPKNWQDLLPDAARLWREASCVMVFTGAGISVPSGIPDFRSPGGLWSKHDPMRVASAEALRSRPVEVWRFLLDADKLMGTARPNPAHRALAAFEQDGLVQGLVTQNIDNLHRAAGSRNVIEFHGNGMRFFCMDCGKPWDAAGMQDVDPGELPVCCPRCKGVIRPDIVFFGESIPTHALNTSMDLAARADLCVIVGTSGEVAPANTLPYRVRERGGRVLEINIGRTAYGSMPDVRLDGPAEEILPLLYDLVTAP